MLQLTFAEKTMKRLTRRQLEFSGNGKPLIIAASLSTGDARRAGVSAIDSITQMRKLREAKVAIKALSSSIRILDNFVDEMPAGQRNELGAAKTGVMPCEMLANLDKRVPSYMAAVEQIAAKGCTTKEEQMAFANLYALFIKEGAKAELDYQRSGNSSDRRRITEANLQLCEVLACNAVQYCFAVPAIIEKVGEGDLSFDDVRRTFPQVTRMGRLTEILDDMQDILIDAELEVKTGITSANSFICRVHELLESYDAMTKDVLLKQFNSFVKINALNSDVVTENSFPIILKEAIKAEQEEFWKLSLEMSSTHRTFMRAWWSVYLEDGLRSSANPDIIKKEARHVAVAQERIGELIVEMI